MSTVTPPEVEATRPLPSRRERVETYVLGRPAALRGWAQSIPERVRAARWAIVGTAIMYLPFFAWFLANKPGFMTYDTFDVWRQAVTNDWEDTHPVIYVIAMKASSVLVSSPALLMFAQGVFMAAVFALLARSLVRAGCQPHITYLLVFLVACTPMVGGFTVTLWKDIPYVASMLGVASRLLDVFGYRLQRRGAPIPRSMLTPLFWWGLWAVLFRQNGVFFMMYLAVAVVAAFWAQRKEVIAGTAVLVAIFLVMKMVLYPVIGVEQTPEEISLAGFAHDVYAVYVERPDLFTQEEVNLISKVISPQTLELSWYHSVAACYGIATWYLHPNTTLSGFHGKSAEYRALWRKVLLRAPGVVLSNRFCVASLAWRVDQKHSGYLYTLTYGVPDNDYGFKTQSALPKWRDRMLKMLAWADEPRHLWYTWRAPGAIYLVYFLLAVRALWARRWIWLLPAALLGAQQLNVITLNPSQDARYMFGSWILAVAFLALLTIRWRRPRRA